MELEWLHNPLKVIDNALEKDMSYEDVSSQFASIIQNEDNYHRIPLLNAKTHSALPPNCLLRFRGMIQEVMDPEYFVPAYCIRSPDGSYKTRMGFCRDCFEMGDDEEMAMDFQEVNKPRERVSIFLFPIPGETTWIQEALQKQCTFEPIAPNIGEDNAPCDTVESTAMDTDEAAKNEANCSTTDGQKRARVGEEGGQSQKKSIPAGRGWSVDSLRSPIPGDSRLPCIAKVYTNCKNLRLHDAVEVVGVLAPPGPTPQQLEGQESEEEEQFAASEAEAGCTRFNPPSSLVPRIHVVALRRLHHLCPLLPRNLLQLTPELEDFWAKVPTAFLKLVDLFQRLFLGDQLLAHYLILHMISSVQNRAASLQSNSHLALNIANVKPAFRMLPKLARIFGLLTPHVVPLPLSLALLNTGNPPFMPIKDVDAQRLLAGRLQLAPGTHLLVDEGALATGQLQARGCLNVRALKSVMELQVLAADCQFHQADLPVDIRVLVLSEGKSFLKSGCLVPWEPVGFENESSIETAYEQVLEEIEGSPALLTELRRFFALASLPGSVGGRPSKYVIPEDMQKKIQESFVESRKSGAPVEEKITSDDLNLMLIMMKLLCAVTGRSDASPDEDLWQQIQKLETERRQRVRRL